MINRFPEYFKKYKKERYEKHQETQADIAKRWDVDASTLSRYAKGYVGSFSLDFLNTVCRDMGVTPNDLLWEEEKSFNRSKRNAG